MSHGRLVPNFAGSSGERVVFRNRFYPILGASLILLAVFAVVTIVVATHPPLGAALAIAVLGAGIAFAAWECYVQPCVIAEPTRLIVRNPFRIYTIPNRRVDGFEAGQLLTIRLDDGTVVKAWAVQSANISLMLKRKSEVDRVADLLARSVQESRGVEATIEVGRRPVSLNLVSWAIALGVLVVLCLRLIVGR